MLLVDFYTTMKNYSTYLKIIIPSVICILGLPFIENIDFYPLLFGIVIGIINWNAHKFKPLIGCFLSIVISYTSYGIGLLSFAFYLFILEFLNENMNYAVTIDIHGAYGYILAPFIIAPIVLFLLYKFVFDIPKTNITSFTIVISIVLLTTQSYFLIIENNYTFQTEKFVIWDPYVIWQVVMALALQVIIYQNEIASFYSKQTESLAD